MTLAEKIGQITQPEKNSIPVEDVTRYFIGSVLSGGGGSPTDNNPANWAEMVRGFQEAALKTRLAIPLIYGSDAVHGHNNVQGAVLFPHNVGLGATRDPDLIAEIARVTGLEMLATNVHWNFAPAVSVPQDIRWGRAFEGYSEETDLVIELGMSYLKALQDETPRALASVKHYAADGGTTWGTTRTYDWVFGNWQAADDRWSIDQGDALLDEATLREVHLRPYVAAIAAGAQNIMVSFSSWNGVKNHANHYLLTDILKGEFGFEGFIVSDWMAINQIDRDYYTCVVASINAGIDMIMVPYDYKLFINTLTEAVEKGDVSIARIDDAVRRILKVKTWLGVFEQPFTDAALLQEVGSAAHRAVAREAVRKSATLLKNENNTLPLAKAAAPVFVAGRGADNLGLQCGGWSIEWQGGDGAITEGTTLLEGFKQVGGSGGIIYSADGHFEGETRAGTGVVVVAENPYAEGIGDSDNLVLSEADIALIQRVRERVDKLALVILSGRPLLITGQLALCDAVVAAWLPGTEGAGLADVLFGDYPFTGKLAYNWPRSKAQIPLAALKADSEPPLFPFGHGLS
ncbi:MAG: glycoside hydrolase family 3 C-terminal domain-containing protein [Anaerolineae bacterium]|nr:glycoside hydrolase family 3 C-terminal domain-containing protein [Anaerolineae bacterium]